MIQYEKVIIFTINLIQHYYCLHFITELDDRSAAVLDMFTIVTFDVLSYLLT